MRAEQIFDGEGARIGPFEIGPFELLTGDSMALRSRFENVRKAEAGLVELRRKPPAFSLE